MQRLVKYNFIIHSLLASKSSLFSHNFVDLKLKLTAGLYKPTSIKLEHGLILSSLSGELVIAKPQLHGKRQKRTISLTTSLEKNNLWACVDKLVHELLTKISDFRTPKFKKPAFNNYTIKLKQKFTPLVDFEDLVSSEMFDTHRGIFLPLTLHLIFDKNVMSQISQTYLRALRLPLNFYVARRPPAFDDLAVFQQTF